MRLASSKILKPIGAQCRVPLLAGADRRVLTISSYSNCTQKRYLLKVEEVFTIIMTVRALQGLKIPLRVLLVEDSKVLAERLIELLRPLKDIRLIAVMDTEAGALAALAHHTVDVMILDLHLKQGTGFGVMRKLRTAHHHMSIIVLTNYDLPEYKNAALSLGANLFLDKALDYARLPELLREIHNITPQATH